MTREQENQVIRQVLDGEINAFETLIHEYEKPVYNIALKMLHNTEEAQDMAQEAFIRAYNSLASFREDSKFSVWLYRIVSNVCIDRMRSFKNRNEVSSSVDDEDGNSVEMDIPDDTYSPEIRLDRKLTTDSVRRGLDLLPPDYRQILLLREIQGLSYDEISEVMNLEPGTVKSKIFRARKKLCQFLVKDGNIPDYLSSKYSEGGM